MKPRDRYIYAFITFVLIIAVACGGGSDAADKKLREIEQRVEQLESTNLNLPPDPLTQIGTTRTWVPKYVSEITVTALLFLLGNQFGLREPTISGGGEWSVSRDGVDYEVWSVELRLGGPCYLVGAFVAELESQTILPTLVIDEIKVSSSTDRFGVPTGALVLFHITARQSDTPAETEKEYKALIQGRGSAAASYASCNLPSEVRRPPTVGEAARAATELTNVQAAMDAAIADLKLSSVNARSSCNDFSSSGGCGLTGGTVPANFLYPSYLRIQTAGDGRTYSWDTTGLVSSP